LDKIDLIEEDLWDHYSGLPNPLWYQYKKQQKDEEKDINDSRQNNISNNKISKR